MTKNNGTQTLESMSQAVWYNRWTVSKFDEYLRGKILEVGCGIGNFTEMLTKYGEVFAIDIDNNHCIAARKTINGKAKVKLGDIENGNDFFQGQKFDTVICLNVLEHIKNDRKGLKNIYYLLKKEGILILLVPAHNFLFGEIDKSIGHYRRYNKHQLGILMKDIGFKILKNRSLNFFGALGWYIAARLLKNKNVDEEKVSLFNALAPIILPIENIIEPPFGTSILIIARK